MRKLRSVWKQLPDKPRRILVFITGLLLIMLSGLIGWIPGPGGTVFFLLGIAVLATEFAWAERLRDGILRRLRALGRWLRQRPIYGLFIGLGAGLLLAFGAYVLYMQIL